MEIYYKESRKPQMLMTIYLFSFMVLAEEEQSMLAAR